MDIEIRCPDCNRRNLLIVSEQQAKGKIYRRCMWNREHVFSVKVIVKKETHAERFLEDRRKVSREQPNQPLTNTSTTDLGTKDSPFKIVKVEAKKEEPGFGDSTSV